MQPWVAIAGILLAAGGGCAALDRSSAHGPDPQTWQQRRMLSREARRASDEGRYGEALGYLEELARVDPESAEPLVRIGGLREETGRPDLAATVYREALERDEDYIDAMIGLGRADLAGGLLESALGRFDEAIEIDPGQVAAHTGRGRTLEALGRTEEALTSYFRVLKGEPDTPEALERVAAIQLDRNQPESALARLEHLAELTPEDPEARLLRGRARLAIRLTEDAIDDLRFADEHLPDRPDVLVPLALALEQAGDLDAARGVVDEAEAIAPDSPAVLALSERLNR